MYVFGITDVSQASELILSLIFDDVRQLKEEDYLLLFENIIKMETRKIARIEKMPTYKAMEHIFQHQHIDLLIKHV